MSGLLVPLLHLLVGIAVPLASFATGLRSSDPRWFWKRPRLLGRSLVAVLLIVPIVGTLLVELIPVNGVVRAGIVVSLLSVGVGPARLPKRTEDPRELAGYQIGLNMALMILAVVFVPAAVAVHGALFHHQLSLEWSRVAELVFLRVFLPFAAGLAVARWRPGFAARVERDAPQLVAVAMLIVAAVAVLVTWHRLMGLSAGAWFSCAAVAMAAIAIGHVAGGPAGETRAVLASFSAIRFPALALLLTSIVPRGALLIPVVVAYLICSALLVAVYRAAMGRGRS